MSILLLPEAFAVVSSACASGAILGGAGIVGIQGIRRRHQAKKQAALEAGDSSKEKNTPAPAVEEKKAEPKPDPKPEKATKGLPVERAKSTEELALEHNRREDERAQEAYSEAKAWLISILNGESEESRGSILRKFYEFGRYSSTKQVRGYRSYENFRKYGHGYGYNDKHNRIEYVTFWQLQMVETAFTSILRWVAEDEKWEVSIYKGSLRRSVSDEDVAKVLPHTAADWESLARLVETAEEEDADMEKVDRFIQLLAANLLLNFNTVSGESPEWNREELAEAGRRHDEVGQVCFELLTQDLTELQARARAPKENTIEVARRQAAKFLAEELEASKKREEDAKRVAEAKAKAAAEAAKAEKADTDESAVEPLADSNGTVIEEPLVLRFQEAYASLTEEEQRAGDKYLERFREAVDAENEAADFSEETKSRVLNLAAENRRIALEQLESLLAASGTSREAELVRKLRVSNRLLVEQQAEGS